MSNKTIATRTAIKTELERVCQRVYYGQADEDAAFPYAIFTVEEVSKIDGVPLCELEVNVVDYGRDTDAVEVMCDTLEDNMDHLTYLGPDVSYTLYFERKNIVEAEDRNIIRRRMVFSFNLYDRS